MSLKGAQKATAVSGSIYFGSPKGCKAGKPVNFRAPTNRRDGEQQQ